MVIPLAVAACGSSDSGGASAPTLGAESTAPSASAGDVTTTTTSTIAAAPTTAPTSTDVTTTTSTTTTSTTSTSTSTTAPTTVPDDSCLEGSWWLSPEQTTGLYSALLPGIPVTVTGTHWVTFAGNTVDYWTILEANFALGGADITFGIDQHGIGTYTVAGDVLSIAYDTFESTIHEGHGEVIYDRTQDPSTYVGNGVDIADNGNGTITVNGVPVPVLDIPPVAGGPVGCDADTFSLGFTSGLADAAAVYVRQP